jgi:hypothetical protein
LTESAPPPPPPFSLSFPLVEGEVKKYNFNAYFISQVFWICF